MLPGSEATALVGSAVGPISTSQFLGSAVLNNPSISVTFSQDEEAQYEGLSLAFIKSQGVTRKDEFAYVTSVVIDALRSSPKLSE
ncbi:hypothetical protein BGZ76_000382 [Entomortierella beljakovae]|nr:hypothetical protein BGZ76_000382 [Entomortierella beljakovae]